MPKYCILWTENFPWLSKSNQVTHKGRFPLAKYFQTCPRDLWLYRSWWLSCSGNRRLPLMLVISMPPWICSCQQCQLLVYCALWRTPIQGCLTGWTPFEWNANRCVLYNSSHKIHKSFQSFHKKDSFKRIGLYWLNCEYFNFLITTIIVMLLGILFV